MSISTSKVSAWSPCHLVCIVTPAKTQQNHAFLNSSLLNIFNLPKQMYALAKFQPDMPIALGVIALQSSNSKKIDLYSKH